MKLRILTPLAIIAIILSGCFVFSFYPLYTEEDLFPNDLLLGEFYDSDSALWHFEHKIIGKEEDHKVDSTCYILTIKEEDKEEVKASFQVKIIKLSDNYFLDFYLEEYEYSHGDDPNLFDLHLIPVHTFARVSIDQDSIQIRWFDPQWLEGLIKENKIRIHHENNGEHILLTAKPKELQKFVIKYVNSEEAFKGGLDEELIRS